MGGVVIVVKHSTSNWNHIFLKSSENLYQTNDFSWLVNFLLWDEDELKTDLSVRNLNCALGGGSGSGTALGTVEQADTGVTGCIHDLLWSVT